MTAETASMKAVAVDIGKVLGLTAVVIALTIAYMWIVLYGALLAENHLPNGLDFLAIPYLSVGICGWYVMMRGLLDAAERAVGNGGASDQ